MKACAIALLLGLAACGSDEDEPDPRVDPVFWNCTATAICDGEEATDSYLACGTEAEIDAAIDEGVADCLQSLEDAGCGAGHCEAECTPTDEEC